MTLPPHRLDPARYKSTSPTLSPYHPIPHDLRGTLKHRVHLHTGDKRWEITYFLAGGFTPASGISSLPWKLPQSKLHFLESLPKGDPLPREGEESPPNGDPFPGRFKTTPLSFLNCLPENEHMVSQFPVVFWFSIFLSVFFLDGGHPGVLAAIKHEHLLIRSNLVCLELLHR